MPAVPKAAEPGFWLVVTDPAPMPGLLVVEVHGTVTYRDAPEFRQGLLHKIRKGRISNCVLDLGGVEHMDTAGLAVLVDCLAMSRESGIRMLLCAPSLSVLKIFRLSGLRDALECCCSTPEEVREKLRG